MGRSRVQLSHCVPCGCCSFIYAFLVFAKTPEYGVVAFKHVELAIGQSSGTETKERTSLTGGNFRTELIDPCNLGQRFTHPPPKQTPPGEIFANHHQAPLCLQVLTHYNVVIVVRCCLLLYSSTVTTSMMGSFLTYRKKF